MSQNYYTKVLFNIFLNKHLIELVI